SIPAMGHLTTHPKTIRLFASHAGAVAAVCAPPCLTPFGGGRVGRIPDLLFPGQLHSSQGPSHRLHHLTRIGACTRRRPRCTRTGATGPRIGMLVPVEPLFQLLPQRYALVCITTAEPQVRAL